MPIRYKPVTVGGRSSPGVGARGMGGVGIRAKPSVYGGRAAAVVGGEQAVPSWCPQVIRSMHPARVTTIVIVAIVVAIGGAGGLYYASQNGAAGRTQYNTKKSYSHSSSSSHSKRDDVSKRGAAAAAMRSFKGVSAGPARHYGTNAILGLREVVAAHGLDDGQRANHKTMDESTVRKSVITYLSHHFGVESTKLDDLSNDALLETATALADPEQARKLRKMRTYVQQVQVGERELSQRLTDWDFLELDDKTQAELAPFRDSKDELAGLAYRASNLLSKVSVKGEKKVHLPGTKAYKLQMAHRAKLKARREWRQKHGIKHTVRFIRNHAENLGKMGENMGAQRSLNIQGQVAQVGQDLRASAQGMHKLTKAMKVSKEIIGDDGYADDYNF